MRPVRLFGVSFLVVGSARTAEAKWTVKDTWCKPERVMLSDGSAHIVQSLLCAMQKSVVSATGLLSDLEGNYITGAFSSRSRLSRPVQGTERANRLRS